MIKLEIDGDLARYIDTEELQKAAENEVRYAIKEQVSKWIRTDAKVQSEILRTVLSKVEDVKLSDEISEILRVKLIETAKGLSNYDIEYHSGMRELLNRVLDEHDPEIEGMLNKRVEQAIGDFQVDKYQFSTAATEVIKEKILENADKLNLDKMIENLVSSGLAQLLIEY